ncbi:dehydrodolichyl diphosphate synthase complex subunit DHDDS [Pelomyxa schiedti]|nr:dehydrodolichyl diphosphate synthase complex subunit DHDDS [Pelomyxa schiedti]
MLMDATLPAAMHASAVAAAVAESSAVAAAVSAAAASVPPCRPASPDVPPLTPEEIEHEIAAETEMLSAATQRGRPLAAGPAAGRAGAAAGGGGAAAARVGVLAAVGVALWAVFGPVVSRVLRTLQWLVIRAARVGPVPRHVAFIMDGNRRFARKHHMPSKAGHAEGYIALLRTMQWCLDLGIKTITVYGFSIENFNRPPEEVAVIMDLAEQKLRQFLASGLDIRARKMGASLKFIGDLSRLSLPLQELIKQAESKLDRHELQLNICFSYTSTYEITNAIKQAVDGVQQGHFTVNDITQDTIEQRLLLQSSPSLIVRTSGEMRLSDFLLWQGINSYFHVTKTYWPEFSFFEMMKALFCYQIHWPELSRREQQALSYHESQHTKTE